MPENLTSQVMEVERYFCKTSGLSVAELSLATAIFSLLMLGIYVALDIGMKTWQLGEVKTDFYSRAKVTLNSISKDFTYSTWISATVENDGNPDSINEYIVFESPLGQDGSLQVDNRNGTPIWQRYIHYYIYPSVKSSPDAKVRNVYRRTKERTPKHSSPLPFFDALLISAQETSGTVLRTVSRDVQSLDFKVVDDSLIVYIGFKANVRKNSTVMFDNSKVTEVIKLKTSVIPQN